MSKFANKVDLGNLKSNVDELGFDKLKTVTSSLNNLKSKVHKLNVDKLETFFLDLKKVK